MPQANRTIVDPDLIRSAWAGRVSGCVPGKAVEVLSFPQVRDGLLHYLREARALPLRDYVPLIPDTVVERRARHCCANHLQRAKPDDDIDYTSLALVLLEQHGEDLTTEDVARDHSLALDAPLAAGSARCRPGSAKSRSKMPWAVAWRSP